MHRNKMGEKSLFQARSVRPQSYRPTTEPLEERVVPVAGLGIDSALSGAINSALSQLAGQSGAGRQAVVERARNLAERALTVATQLDLGQITFADATQQMTALRRELLQLRRLPGAQNLRFRLAQQDFLLLREFVQGQGGATSQNGALGALRSLIAEQLSGINPARLQQFLDTLSAGRTT